MQKKIGYSVFITLMFITPAYAYLDSGTGSVIVQMLFAGVAGIAALAKLYWEKVKTITRRIKQRLCGHAITTTEQHNDKT